MPRRKIVERIGLESLEVEGMKKLNKNKKLVKKLAMKEKQIFQNVQMSINFLVSLLKKNWQNVKLFTETLNKRMVEPRRNLFTVLTSRAIFQRMKNYTIYAVSITIRIVLGFMLLALIWKFDFSPFMVLIIAILNDGTIMTISKDRVKPSPQPDSWKLGEIFTTGIALGGYLAVLTVIFFWAAYETNFFPRTFGVATLQKGEHDDLKKLASAVYLQVSTISQALIFVTRARSWSFVERPGHLLVVAFLLAQLVATVIAVYANWSFAAIEGIGWGWAGVIWLYNLVFYIPLDFIKLLVQYTLSGRAWDHVIERKVAFTTKKDFGREERERRWAHAQRSLHGLHPLDTQFGNSSRADEGSQIAGGAKRRADVSRLRDLNTLKAAWDQL